MKKKENISLDKTSFKIIAKTNINWGIDASLDAVEPTIPEPPGMQCDTSVIRVSSRSGACSVVGFSPG